MSDSEAPRIGTAGWSVPSAAKGDFSAEGSQLTRYSSTFSCVEINSSFYRPHRVQTYARWAASVPATFRFAVKAPRILTHERRLQGAREPLRAFVDQISALGPALGPMLVQLPPSLNFDLAIASDFFCELRRLFVGEVVFEPRHPSWFELAAEALLLAHRVARVAADPAPVAEAAAPGGWLGLRYWRLHGSPRMYYTPYGEDRLCDLAGKLSPGDWCIFDNTASGAAVTDALRLRELMQAEV